MAGCRYTSLHESWERRGSVMRVPGTRAQGSTSLLPLRPPPASSSSGLQPSRPQPHPVDVVHADAALVLERGCTEGGDAN